MFSWFKKKPTSQASTARASVPQPSTPQPARPQAPPDGPQPNPSLDDLPHQFRVALSAPGAQVENIDLVDVLARLLADNGHELEREGNAIVLHPSGLKILPVLGNLQPNDDGSVRTMTITRVRHPAFGTTEVFEFQHAGSATAEKSVRQGFDQWHQVDLVALLNALSPKPQGCMTWEMEFPATDSAPGRTRRVVFSPVAHFAQHPLPAPVGESGESEKHGSSCPCCMLTNSGDAFNDLLKSDGFHALRLYASRDPDGHPTADCRINGLDYDPGKLALCKYVERWPDQGVEFRKQYVIIQNAPPRTEK